MCGKAIYEILIQICLLYKPLESWPTLKQRIFQDYFKNKTSKVSQYVFNGFIDVKTV